MLYAGAMTTPRTTTSHTAALDAQATLHHAYFLGLQLMVTTQAGAETCGDWLFRLFRRQHEEYFLKSFNKLGLDGLPDAVACARYHVLANSIGGVPVEYAEESPTKAWVRFRYPRWMFDGPTICGVPVAASRGFLRGWYAHNGVSLNNPRLGFVCVSEDMTGEFGFCGYFREFDHALSDDERLQFARGELPPPFSAADQPQVPAANWNKARLARANCNYAVAYVRNGIDALVDVIGQALARELGARAARLIGLQYFNEMAARLDIPDGDYAMTGRFLCAMFEGLGDRAQMHVDSSRKEVTIEHTDLRVVAGTTSEKRAGLLACWTELWLGTIHAHRIFKRADVVVRDNGLRWTVSDRE